MDETLKTVLISFVGILLAAAVGGVIALYARVRKLEGQILVMATQVQPFWAVVQEKMVKDLTHPAKEFHEADALLAKLKDKEIDAEERARLLELMEHRVIDPNPKIALSERETAGGLAFVMRKVEEEEASAAPIAEVQVVAIKEAEKVVE